MKTLLSFQLPSSISYRINPRKHRKGAEPGKMKYANIKFIRSAGVNLISQSYSSYLHYIEDVSIKAKMPKRLNLIANYSSIVLVYVLRGDIHLSTPDNQKKISIKTGHCRVIHMAQGNLELELDTERIQWIYFALRTEWLMTMQNVYPEFSTILQKMINGTAEFATFNEQAIEPVIYRQLLKLKSFNFSSKSELEEALLHSINILAKDYHNHLHAIEIKKPKSSRQIAGEARDLIIEMVEKGVMPTIQTIAEPFFIEPRVLRRHCQEAFHMNFKELIEDAQMKFAYPRIKRGSRVSDIAMHLGFSATSVFSTKYKNYFGHSPRQSCAYANN